MNYKEIVFKNTLNILARISREKHGNLPNKENPVDFTGPCRFHFNSNNKVSMKFSFLYLFLGLGGLFILIISHRQLGSETLMALSYTMFKGAFIVGIVWFLLATCLFVITSSNDKYAVGIPIDKGINREKRIPAPLQILDVSFNNNLPDLTYEFSALMKFVANIAIDIRLYSAYSKGIREDDKGHAIDSQNDPNTPYDLMYLSNILHNFSNLSFAIDDGDIHKIIAECDAHISTYECYLGKYPNRLKQMMGNPVETFQRHKKFVDLNMAIKIFKQIKTKCIMQLEIFDERSD